MCAQYSYKNEEFYLQNILYYSTGLLPHHRQEVSTIPQCTHVMLHAYKNFNSGKSKIVHFLEKMNPWMSPQKCQKPGVSTHLHSVYNLYE